MRPAGARVESQTGVGGDSVATSQNRNGLVRIGEPARRSRTFTMFQTPGMPDELFASQYESLTRESENIKALCA